MHFVSHAWAEGVFEFYLMVFFYLAWSYVSCFELRELIFMVFFDNLKSSY